jgi:DivIVA domain-containing protein
MTAANYDLSSPSMSADAVRAARFSSKRHGLDEKEVRTFLDGVANAIQAADAERASLRAELHEIRAEVERIRGTVTAEESQSRMEISVHAVGLLSQAQQTADSCVAEAEQYARDLISTARNQYQEILQKAQQAAAQSMSEVSAVTASGSSDEPVVSLPEIEYVRTFARVAQVQLRSVLDALTQEVDKLGQLPRFDDVQPGSGPQGVSWEPSNLVPLNVTRADTG